MSPNFFPQRNPLSLAGYLCFWENVNIQIFQELLDTGLQNKLSKLKYRKKKIWKKKKKDEQSLEWPEIRTKKSGKSISIVSEEEREQMEQKKNWK